MRILKEITLGKSEIIFTGFRYLTYALQIVRGLLIAKFLGPIYFGVFGLVILIQQYLLYSNLGIHQLLNAELAINLKNDHKILTQSTGYAFLLTTIINFVLISIAVLYKFYNINPFYHDLSVNHFVLILFLATLINYQQLFLNIFRVYNKLEVILISEILIIISTSLPLLFFENDTLIFAFISSWIGSLILVLTLYCLKSPIRIFLSLNLKEALVFLQNGFPFFLYNLSFFLIVMVSRTVIAVNFSTLEMGYYSFANNISTAFMLGFDTITWLIFPKIISFFSQTNIAKDDLENSIVGISKKINLVVFSTVIVFIFLVPLIFLFFPEFLDSIKIIPILLLTQAVFTSGFAIISLYVSRRRYMRLAMFSFLGFILCYISAKYFVYFGFNYEWIAFSTLLGSLTFINLLNFWGSVDFNLSYSKIVSPFTHIMQISILTAAICILLDKVWISIFVFIFFLYFMKDIIVRYLDFFNLKKRLKKIYSFFLTDIYYFNYEYTSEKLGILRLPGSNNPRGGVIIRIVSLFKNMFKSANLFSENEKVDIPRESDLFFANSKNEEIAFNYLLLGQKSSYLVGQAKLYKNDFPYFKIYLLAIFLVPVVFIRKVFSRDAYENNSYQYVFDGFCIAYSCQLILPKWVDSLKPKRLVFSNHLSNFNRCLVKIAFEKNIETVYIQHASVNSNYPPLDYFELIFLEGIDAYQKYKNAGSRNSSIYLVGMSKFDEYKDFVKKRESTYSLALCTNGLDSIKEIEKLIKSLRKYKDFDIYLRPHPSDRRKQGWKKLAERYSIIYSDVQSQISFDFLRSIDILISGDSNIHLEAALLNIYSIYFDTNNSKLDWYGFLKNDLVAYYSEADKVCQNVCFVVDEGIDVRAKAKIYCESINTKYDGNTNFLISSVLNKSNVDSIFYKNRDDNQNEVFSLTNYDPNLFK